MKRRLMNMFESMNSIFWRALAAVMLTTSMGSGAPAEEIPDNLLPENLAAWCIVPFDASKRGPADRAKMLRELGILRCAYDWRAQHVPEFEQEIVEYKKNGIEFFAFWGEHEDAFKLFVEHEIRPQIWKMIGAPEGDTREDKVNAAAKSLAGVAKWTAEIGCKLALYNHGGWGGEPANMVAVCERLRELGFDHVGIVYNWHHGHGHIADWARSLSMMKPYLFCLNINGMNTDAQPKILPLGQGEHDLNMLRVLIESGYDGPVGILDHQAQLDSKEALQDNLDGLSWLRKELSEPGSGGAKPVPVAKPTAESGKAPPAKEAKATLIPSISRDFGTALSGGLLIEGNSAWRKPPVTVECRVKLTDANGYNIIVASDGKRSGAHWELFSMTGTGSLTAYIPGATPDHVRSKSVITDNEWHAIAMQYGAKQVKLWVDGTLVAEQDIELDSKPKIVAGKLGVGRLVDGGFRMRGAVDDLRIRRGLHDDVQKVGSGPLQGGGIDEIGLWDFNDPEILKSAATQAFPRVPLNREDDPYWQEHVNRNRVYDFYAKQAILYGSDGTASREEESKLLPAFPGLDGGEFGHWGNQNDQDTWKDGRVREMDHGSMVSGVFRGGGKTIPRAIAVKLGGGANVVFDQEALSFVLAWEGDLVQWSDVRRGFTHGIKIGSDDTISVIGGSVADSEHERSRYLGVYRTGERVVFAVSCEGVPRYFLPRFEADKVVVSEVAKPGAHQPQWPKRVMTKGVLGNGQPYAIDTLTLPFDNPYNALFFVGGVDFVSGDRIAICNIHGDVWICDRESENLSSLLWKRFACGLHQPLGLVVVEGVIHVRCRDQIVALHDLNGDDEADFYECISQAQETSPGGHDFITGLQRDQQGRWYFASGNQGLCRVNPEGDQLKVLGTGLRNPNGLGISPDGSVILTSVQEGNWTPASAICDVSKFGHFGAGGPKDGVRGYVPPMIYLPRGVDNSSGGQAYIDSNRWGPVKGQWVHFSGGFAKHFLILRETIAGNSQAAAIPLAGEFLSGAHRGRFSPFDGQLYVVGAQGWGNYGVEDGSLQRVRYTGGSFHYPIAYETRYNGVVLTFDEPQSTEIAESEKWFAQQWNYIYGPGYGSPEQSVLNPDKEGHDIVEIVAVHRLDGGRRIFLEMPQLQRCDQLHLHFNGQRRLEVFATLHNLGKPFTDYEGYKYVEKVPVLSNQIRDGANMHDPKLLIQACVTCHHQTDQVVGPSLNGIRDRYNGNPEGIVDWAMDPKIKNPQLPPMPSFQFLGRDKLRIVADFILQE